MKKTLSLLLIFLLTGCQAGADDSIDVITDTLIDAIYKNGDTLYEDADNVVFVDDSRYAMDVVTGISITLTDEHFHGLHFADVIFMDEEAAIIYISLESSHEYREREISDNLQPLAIRTTSNQTIDNRPIRMPALYFVNDASVRWSAVAFDNYENFFMPLIISSDASESQKITRFSSSMGFRRQGELQGTVIREMEHGWYVNFFVEDNYMILFEPHFENGNFIYKVTRLNLADHSEEIIIDKKFCLPTNYGEVIANIFVENSRVFLYRIKIDREGTRQFFIDEYDFYGNRIVTYPLEIEAFLYMYEVSDEDSAFRLFKFEEYFIITTIHNRITIFRLEDSSLVEMHVPPSIQRLGSATILENFSQCSNLIYFWNFMNTLYIFDSLQERFFAVEITLQASERTMRAVGDTISNIYRNRAGDLLIQFEIDQDAYMIWLLEKHLEAKEGTVTGGNGFPPDGSFFYILRVDELKQYFSAS